MSQLKLDQLPMFIGQSNVEIEELVLGCFVNFPDTYYLLSDQVSIKDFTRSETRYIYQAIKEVSKQSKIDIATITDMLVKKKYIDLLYAEKQMNMNVYLENICDSVDTDSHIKEHLKILNEYNQKREFFILSRDISESCNNSESTNTILNMINQKVLNIQEMGEVVDFTVDGSIKEMLEDLDSESSRGCKSGIPKVDAFMHQFDLNNLIIIAGAPSMGKTAFALEIFKNAFMYYDYKPMFFSLEMTVLELTKRMIASCSCVELRKIREKKFDPIDRADLNKTAKSFKNKVYFIDDKSRKLGKILNQIRKHVIRHGTSLVIIDYMQLVSNSSKSVNREQEIAQISRSFKEIAAELEIVIISLSQLNRQVSARVNKRPMLSDLRESGSIEQDADMVIFPFRPAYYDAGEKSIPPIENDVEIIFAKGRSVGIGSVYVSYISKYVKFVSDNKEHEKIQVLTNENYSIKKDEDTSGDSYNSNKSLLGFSKKNITI